MGPLYIDAATLAAATGTDPDEWAFDAALGEWKSEWHDCDGPNWEVEDDPRPYVLLTWGELTMRWCCESVDELPGMMAALRRAADAFNEAD